ncbi:hypothetical protein [Deinococcus humi]|uniref:Uncharacterized protein n=1 Tax=Deinococcus humi TaxID=662880 RepID=A0A7W8NH81_9DEIO|nr:hypothetical protein [Deinococcus humi]MBB5366286.1 hypothetical protein [Deinococcus humi]
MTNALRARRYPLPQGARPTVFRDLEAAGLAALHKALQAAGGRATVIPVPGTPLSWM